MIKQYENVLKRDAQQLQRDRAAGCAIVFAKSRRLELGDNGSLYLSLKPKFKTLI